MLVKMGKNYRDGYGTCYRILCIDRNYPDFPVVAEAENGLLKEFTAEGQFLAATKNTYYDLVEVSPYDDFKLDDKVFVSTDGQTWHRRHFAFVNKDGIVEAWAGGKTSFTTTETGLWEFCKKT